MVNFKPLMCVLSTMWAVGALEATDAKTAVQQDEEATLQCDDQKLMFETIISGVEHYALIKRSGPIRYHLGSFDEGVQSGMLELMAQITDITGVNFIKAPQPDAVDLFLFGAGSGDDRKLVVEEIGESFRHSNLALGEKTPLILLADEFLRLKSEQYGKYKLSHFRREKSHILGTFAIGYFSERKSENIAVSKGILFAALGINVVRALHAGKFDRSLAPTYLLTASEVEVLERFSSLGEATIKKADFHNNCKG